MEFCFHLIVECVVVHLEGAVTVLLCHSLLVVYGQQAALGAASEGLEGRHRGKVGEEGADT